MEDKKTVQVNNLQIRWNKNNKKWQVCTPAIKDTSYLSPRAKKYRLVLELFNKKKDAIRFAENTLDYTAKGKFGWEIKKWKKIINKAKKIGAIRKNG